MPSLDTQPNTVSKDQLARMHAIARDLGMDHAALRESAGVESLRELSKAEASRLITRLGGGDLPNEPGQARRPPRRRSDPNTTRMITPENVDQICRLGRAYFDGDDARFARWLESRFAEVQPRPMVADQVRDFATAGRASKIIKVLEGMHRRRKRRAARPEGGHVHLAAGASPARERKRPARREAPPNPQTTVW